MKVKAYWRFGGEPMCYACLLREIKPDEEMNGGYRIETDKPPTCPACGRELDLTYIGDDPQWQTA